MTAAVPYQLLADAVLVAHFAVVVFVIGGPIAVVVGNLRSWFWVNRPLFRVAHLAAIGFVALQSWLGASCPLTHLEGWLRLQAGQGSYSGSFIQHWIQRVLFYEAPSWVFVAVYSAFLLLVIAIWIRYPPRLRPAETAAVTRRLDDKRVALLCWFTVAFLGLAEEARGQETAAVVTQSLAWIGLAGGALAGAFAGHRQSAAKAFWPAFGIYLGMLCVVASTRAGSMAVVPLALVLGAASGVLPFAAGYFSVRFCWSRLRDRIRQRQSIPIVDHDQDS